MADVAARQAAQRLGRGAVTLALATLLGACGGASTSAPAARAPVAPTSAPPPQPVAAPSPREPTGAGLWYGETLGRDGRVSSQVMCIVSEGEELACIFYPVGRSADYAVRAARGTLSLGLSSPSGSGRLYAASGTTLADGVTVVADFSITGGPLSSRSRFFEFTLSSAGEVSTLSAQFDHYYDQRSSLARLAHVYETFSLFGVPASLTIQNDGALFSQSASGCIATGSVGLIDPMRNVYDATLRVSNCGARDGAYEGLASQTGLGWDGRFVLQFAIFSAQNFIVAEAAGDF